MPFMFLDSFTQKQGLPKVHLLIQHYLKECLLHHYIYIKKRCQQSGRNSFFQNRAKGRITNFNISVACNAAEAIASTLSGRIVKMSKSKFIWLQCNFRAILRNFETTFRRGWDSNPRGQSPMDQQSIALTTRPPRLLIVTQVSQFCF